MATVFYKYDHTHRRFIDGTMDWDTDTFKLALVTGSYVYSSSHTLWEHASPYEVASGNGYTTGGVALTTLVDNAKMDAEDVTWSSLSKTFRGAVLYCNKVANGLTNPLVGYVLFNDAGIDVNSPGIEFMVMWSTQGIFSIG